MTEKYEPNEIEPKWQKFWEERSLFKVETNDHKPKYYSLMEFPYPSGEGLHTGHVRGYTAMDIISRKRRMQGYNVLFPIGWDAFGLPTENYAIKTGLNPRIVTAERTDNYRKQFKSLGMSFNWDREVNTADPKYYKWTQWIFLQFLKHDLAYKTKTVINWCPKDKIGLANEEVVGGACERCGTQVEKKEKEQWILRITKYADRLEKDLEDLDYQDKIKIQQKNWIGISKGREINFELNFKKNPTDNDNRDAEGKKAAIKIFTTRPDTILGATYLVLAPEHLWVTLATDDDHNVLDNKDEVKEYLNKVKNRTDIERTAEGKEKTGVEVKGVKAINPSTGDEISIWVADYVLPNYGTGAIMAVPSDDRRDKEFAEKFNLPIISDYEKKDPKIGADVTKYKLRDWIFSRQRYWGEPIPIIHCEKCGVVPVPEKDLPVILPDVEKYEPTDTGESPLANILDWVNVKCPNCKGNAQRETDVMPNWAGSSWYFLRYTDPENDQEFASKENLKYWMEVDWYNGGMEHTVLHLLYSRFWNKFLFDIGLVPTSEPYLKRTSHGLILAENGEKMSKSRGNVINPDDIVNRFGADTLRLYEMFMGPFDQAIAWSEDALVGPRRFIEKVWKLQKKVTDKDSPYNEISLNQIIKKVTDDIEEMKFNTAISAMMMYANELEEQDIVTKIEYKTLLLLLSPFAPHVSEELWEKIGSTQSISKELWPTFNQNMIVDKEVKIVVQVNGKVRAILITERNLLEEEVKSKALNLPEISKWVTGTPQKVIVVPNKVVNIVL